MHMEYQPLHSSGDAGRSFYPASSTGSTVCSRAAAQVSARLARSPSQVVRSRLLVKVSAASRWLSRLLEMWPGIQTTSSGKIPVVPPALRKVGATLVAFIRDTSLKKIGCMSKKRSLVAMPPCAQNKTMGLVGNIHVRQVKTYDGQSGWMKKSNPPQKLTLIGWTLGPPFCSLAHVDPWSCPRPNTPRVKLSERVDHLEV